MKKSLKNLLSALLFCSANSLQAQNQLSLQLESGEPFKVLIRDRQLFDSAQSHVLIPNVTEDTLHVKIQLSSGERYGVTLYLLDKRKPANRKEFSYLLKKEKGRLKPVFMGMYSAPPFREK